MADRREFIRRITVSAVFLAVGAVGLFELVSKLAPPEPQQLTTEQSTQTSQQQASTESSLSTQQSSQQQTSQQSTRATTQQQSSSSAQTTQQGPPSGYIFLAPLSALSGKSYAYFSHPTYGESMILNYGGSWRAFSAVCTHAGCICDFTGSSIYCNCHSGYFSPVNGSVQSGPPPTPLAEYGVIIQNGSVYVSQARIN